MEESSIAETNHLELALRGARVWNPWRRENSSIRPDLSNARLIGKNLTGLDLMQADLNGAQLNGAVLTGAGCQGANFSGATLVGAKLNGASLVEADLTDSDLSEALLNGANLNEAKLIRTKLRGAKLIGANLDRAYIVESDLRGADFTEACLQHCSIVNSNLDTAILRGCRIFGISAWDVSLEDAVQSNLIITPQEQASIQLDSLEVAQFVYLLLNNSKIRHVIDTITAKLVLILGRFTPERKTVLEAIRDELRHQDYLPVLFDFDKPTNRDITETVSTLAHMARFVIADLTDARSIPQELARIVPDLPSVPVQPILLASKKEWSMYETFSRYEWVLPIYHYENQAALVSDLPEKVIAPAEQKANEQVRYMLPKIKMF